MISTLKQAAIRIAPGEPVPPGFEGEVKPVAQLQPLLDKHISTALVGLEYVIEMFRQGDDASYRCILCDRGYYRNYDSKAIMTHILTDSHRTAFLTRHFPTAMRELAQYRDNKGVINILSGVIDALCSAIEDTYGRMTPAIFETSEFLENREKYTKKVFDDKHFDESYGKTFTDIIDHKSISREVKKNINKATAEKNTPSKKEIPTKSYSSHLSSISNVPDENSVEEISDAELKTKQYRFMLDAAVRDLDKMFDKYETRPESHPQYASEWKLFWTDRCEELRQKNINPNKYNFSTEWSKFWLRRLKELYEDELLYQKRELKKQLNIRPLTSEEPVPYIATTAMVVVPPPTAPSIDKNISKEMPLKHVDNKPFDEEFDDFEDSFEVTSSTKRPLDELDRVSPASIDEYEEKHTKRQRRSMSLTKISDESDEDDPNITLIAVLRILTVFEDYLGSLGPKVVDLLSKAVALEKVKPNLADDLLLNDENSILLETCKEKLTGQILAGILDRAKVAGVKKAISNVKAIVRNIDKKTRENSVAHALLARQAAPAPIQQTQQSSQPKPIPIDSILSSEIFKQIVSTINLGDSGGVQKVAGTSNNPPKDSHHSSSYDMQQYDPYRNVGNTFNQSGYEDMSGVSSYNNFNAMKQTSHYGESSGSNFSQDLYQSKNNSARSQSSGFQTNNLLESNNPVYQTNNTQRKMNYQFGFAEEQNRNYGNASQSAYPNYQGNYGDVQQNVMNSNVLNHPGSMQSNFSGNVYGGNNTGKGGNASRGGNGPKSGGGGKGGRGGGGRGGGGGGRGGGGGKGNFNKGGSGGSGAGGGGNFNRGGSGGGNFNRGGSGGGGGGGNFNRGALGGGGGGMGNFNRGSSGGGGGNFNRGGRGGGGGGGQNQARNMNQW